MGDNRDACTLTFGDMAVQRVDDDGYLWGRHVEERWMLCRGVGVEEKRINGRWGSLRAIGLVFVPRQVRMEWRHCVTRVAAGGDR